MIISWFSLQVEEGDPSPLLSTGKATPAVQCPVVGSSVQERYRATRQSPLPLGRSAKMIKALEHLLEEEKAESWPCSAWRRYGSGGSHPCTQISEGKMQRGWSQALFSGVQSQDKMQWAQTERQCCLNIRKQFSAMRWSTGTCCPKNLQSLHPYRWRKMSEHGTEQLALGGQAWAGEVEQNDLQWSLPISAILKTMKQNLTT